MNFDQIPWSGGFDSNLAFLSSTLAWLDCDCRLSVSKQERIYTLHSVTLSEVNLNVTTPRHRLNSLDVANSPVWGQVRHLRGLGAVAPKENKKKEKKEEREKKKEGRKGTVNNVKLLHIKWCFLKFFNSPVALKNNNKNLAPHEKIEMTPLCEGEPQDLWFTLVLAIAPVTHTRLGAAWIAEF